jgi:hypothetical protein
MTGTRLRLAKGIALDKKDRKVLREVDKAFAKIGHDLNGPMTELEARELDFELENDLVRTALYRHFDKDGNLLYVGVSLNAIERTISHRDKSPWYQDIARIEIEWHTVLVRRPIITKSEPSNTSIHVTTSKTNASPPKQAMGTILPNHRVWRCRLPEASLHRSRLQSPRPQCRSLRQSFVEIC